MPKSRVRQKAVYTPPPQKSAAKKVSPPWIAPAFVSSILIGLAWIVLYYLTNNGVPGLSSLGSWNMLVGGAFIIGGLVLATRWH